MKKVLLTTANRQPYQRGLYTIAIPQTWATEKHVKSALSSFIPKLLNALNLNQSDLFIDPIFVDNLKLDDCNRASPAMMQPSQEKDRRYITLTSNKIKWVAFCVDGRLSNVEFHTQSGRQIPVFRYPGPDDQFTSPLKKNTLGNFGLGKIIQHGEISPKDEKKARQRGKKSGCGWRDAHGLLVKDLRCDLFILHSKNGNKPRLLSQF